jgi:FlaA1/EpsC-like NDP-sugar epimerase
LLRRRSHRAPKFKEQIARGGPVNVTHPDMVRYIMTIPEAARLVLQAAALGDSGQVLVLDMGEPVKLVELARELIRLSGHTLEEIAIEFSGVRAWEKMCEEALADADQTLATHVPLLRVARLTAQTRSFADALAGINGDARGADRKVRVRRDALMPEYRGSAADKA